MANVVIRKSDIDGFYSGTAGEFKLNIDRAGKHEPRSIDLVLLGLGACTISTIAHYLGRKGVSAESLAVELSAEFDEKQGMYKDFSVKLHLGEDVPQNIRKVIPAIAKTCRIHRTLEATPHVTIELAEPASGAVC